MNILLLGAAGDSEEKDAQTSGKRYEIGRKGVLVTSKREIGRELRTMFRLDPNSDIRLKEILDPSADHSHEGSVLITLKLSDIKRLVAIPRLAKSESHAPQHIWDQAIIPHGIASTRQ